MKKTILSFLLTAALMLSLISCNSKPAQNNQPESQPTPTKEEEKVTDVSLMVKTSATMGDWNKFWVIDMIEKYCGIRFKVEQVPSEGWDEKKNLAFASNTLPDVFLNDLTDVELATYGGQGIILPLEKYMTKEKMPDFYQVMEGEGFPGLISAMTFPDGHIYSFKGVNGSEREYAKSRFFINKEWAKNLGAAIPTTLDEYYTYLKAIKDGDPNGNGDNNDEIPFGGRYDTYNDGFIPVLTALGYTEKTYDVKDGKVIYVPAEANYKEFLNYMHKLYSEGLIDKEYFTQTDDQRKAKQAQGLVGTFTDHAAWLNISDPAIWRQYGSIEPMTSSLNNKKLWPAKDVIFYGGLAVTNNVKDEKVLEKIMKFANWCYSLEGTTILWRGPEYGTWDEYPETGWKIEKEADGTENRVYTFPTDKYETNGAFTSALIKPGNNFWPYATIPSRQDKQVLSEERYKSPESTDTFCLTYDIVTYQAPYYHIGWPDTCKFTADESSELSLIETDLTNYKKTMESKMIIGELKIEDTFNEYINGLNSRNLKRYLEILQTAYDRYEKASKK